MLLSKAWFAVTPAVTNVDTNLAVCEVWWWGGGESSALSLMRLVIKEAKLTLRKGIVTSLPRLRKKEEKNKTALILDAV